MTGPNTETLTIAAEDDGARLDRVLAARIPALSRSRLKALILAGEVAIEGRTISDPSERVKSGARISVNVPEPEPAKPQGENIPLNIVYEDDDLIVIDKPAGLVVHPAAGHPAGTLVNALIAHCGDSLSGIGGVKRPGIVHRLDKDTSGLMVVAKNDRAHTALSAQFASKGEGGLERGYLAFAWGAPLRPRGTIDAPLDRHPGARDKRAVRQGGRQAVTHWHLLATYAGNDGKPAASLIECRLETGRTHQIRVHLAHIGHPLLGDATYSAGYRTKAARLPPDPQAALAALGRQALHAYLLVIEHPTTGQRLEFKSELPGDLARLRHILASGGQSASAAKAE
jgi:23S rRNA pseudouridine1911/1915/1917 synthase